MVWNLVMKIQVSRLNNGSWPWVCFKLKIHLISPGCPWTSIALQCRIVAPKKSFICTVVLFNEYTDLAIRDTQTQWYISVGVSIYLSYLH